MHFTDPHLPDTITLWASAPRNSGMTIPHAGIWKAFCGRQARYAHAAVRAKHHTSWYPDQRACTGWAPVSSNARGAAAGLRLRATPSLPAPTSHFTSGCSPDISFARRRRMASARFNCKTNCRWFRIGARDSCRAESIGRWIAFRRRRSTICCRRCCGSSLCQTCRVPTRAVRNRCGLRSTKNCTGHIRTRKKGQSDGEPALCPQAITA